MDERDKIINELRRKNEELEEQLSKVWHEDDPEREDMYLVLWKPSGRRGDPFYGLCQFEGEWLFNDVMKKYEDKGQKVSIIAWTYLPDNF